jgi:hypothetical protein
VTISTSAVSVLATTAQTLAIGTYSLAVKFTDTKSSLTDTQTLPLIISSTAITSCTAFIPATYPAVSTSLSAAATTTPLVPCTCSIPPAGAPVTPTYSITGLPAALTGIVSISGSNIAIASTTSSGAIGSWSITIAMTDTTSGLVCSSNLPLTISACVTSVTAGTISSFIYTYGDTAINTNLAAAFGYTPATCTGITLSFAITVNGTSTLPSAFSLSAGVLTTS